MSLSKSNDDSGSINNLIEDSSVHTSSNASYFYIDDVEIYDIHYANENEDLTFFQNIGTHSIEGLEKMVFSRTDLENSKSKGGYFTREESTMLL